MACKGTKHQAGKNHKTHTPKVQTSEVHPDQLKPRNGYTWRTVSGIMRWVEVHGVSYAEVMVEFKGIDRTESSNER